MGEADGRQPARYDGVADWYDAQLEGAPHRRQVMLDHVGAGDGLCLDVGCGTGRDLATITSTGRTPVGLELSRDQLRLASQRGDLLVQGDAEHLPFASGTFPMVTSSWTSTDVDDFTQMVREIARVLTVGGQFVFYGIHPCFNGPHVESRDDRARIVHPTYRDARRHQSAPWWGTGGIREKAGGMRHVPLGEFLNAFISAGLQLEHVAEPDDEPVPYALVVRARKQTPP